MSFLDKLDSLMAQHGLNNHSLSIQSGIPYTTIDGWYKKGYDNAKLSTIKKLAEFFNVPLDYFVDGEGGHRIEKVPAPESTGAGTSQEDEVMDILLQAFIKAGLMTPGQDLTKQQVDILNAVYSILRATFRTNE